MAINQTKTILGMLFIIISIIGLGFIYTNPTNFSGINLNNFISDIRSLFIQIGSIALLAIGFFLLIKGLFGREF